MVAEHPNVALVRQGFAASADGDTQTLSELMAADVVWHSPGRNQISGTYHGVAEIMGYFGKFAALCQGQFQVELLDVLANDHRAIALTRDTATRNGVTLSWEGGVVFHLQDGMLIEAWAFNYDQHQVDAFWA